MQTLKEVADPEIGLNVVDLNMIKKVNIDDKKIEVRIVLTTPFVCWLVFLLKKSKRRLELLQGAERWILWCLMNPGYHLKDSGDKKNILMSQAQEIILKG